MTAGILTRRSHLPNPRKTRSDRQSHTGWNCAHHRFDGHRRAVHSKLEEEDWEADLAEAGTGKGEAVHAEIAAAGALVALDAAAAAAAGTAAALGPADFEGLELVLAAVVADLGKVAQPAVAPVLVAGEGGWDESPPWAAIEGHSHVRALPVVFVELHSA